MPRHYGTFEPLDPLPAHFPNALQDFLSSLGLGGVQLRIKPGSPNTLQVPAGVDDAQVGLTIGGRWRYATANVEIAGAGPARGIDVYATTANNVYTASSVTVGGTTYPVEEDDTAYAFALAIVDAGGAPPAGADASRRIGIANWDGSQFVTVVPIIGGVVPEQGPPLLEFLPGDVVDGQEVYYLADATDGVIWHLRYNAGSASPYKWEFVGGGALHNEVATLETTSSAGYVDLATVGPSITVPLAGDYEVVFAAHVRNSATSATGPAFALKFGTAAVSDADACYLVAGAGAESDLGKSLERTVGAPGTVVKLQYGAYPFTTPGLTGYARRTLRIRPTRVG